MEGETRTSRGRRPYPRQVSGARWHGQGGRCTGARRHGRGTDVSERRPYLEGRRELGWRNWTFPRPWRTAGWLMNVHFLANSSWASDLGERPHVPGIDLGGLGGRMSGVSRKADEKSPTLATRALGSSSLVDSRGGHFSRITWISILGDPIHSMGEVSLLVRWRQQAQQAKSTAWSSQREWEG